MSTPDDPAHKIGPGPQCWHYVPPGTPWPPVLRRAPHQEDCGYHLDSDGPCPPPHGTRPPMVPPPAEDFPF